MGVLNVTPDSFSDGGKFFDAQAAVVQAQRMIAEGADIIDVGGASSRPGADVVPVQEELRRVVPVIEAIAGAAGEISVSIDTFHPEVAAAALDAGATMVNDITGLADEGMMQLVARRNVPVVIMHMQGTPQNMQKDPKYSDVVEDVVAFFKERITAAKRAGVSEQNIILDPGIGFGKKLEHNLQILKNVPAFRELGFPVLIGASRKSFIEKITGLPVEERLEATLAAHVVAALGGADIVRVHDVQEHKRALAIADSIRNA